MLSGPLSARIIINLLFCSIFLVQCSGSPVNVIQNEETDDSSLLINDATSTDPPDWGLQVYGYNNMHMESGQVISGKVANVDWNIMRGQFHANMSTDTFSLIFKGYITVPNSGQYTFRTKCDDGSVLTVDGEMVVDNWTSWPGGFAPQKHDDLVYRHYEAGQWYSFHLLYFEHYGKASCTVYWSNKNKPGMSFEVVEKQFFRSTIGPRVVVEQQMVELSDDNGGAYPIQVHLSHEPESDVIIFIENYMFRWIDVSACSLIFTKDNYFEKQTVHLVPKPVLVGDSFVSNGTLKLISQSSDNLYNNQTIEVSLSKTSKPKRICHSWGDPHLKTFGNKKYDLYEQGDFYLYRQKDASLVIQTRQEPCGRKVSCNYGMVAQYNNYSKIIVTVDQTGNYDIHYINQINAIQFRQLNGKHFRVEFPNGVVLRVKISYWGGGRTWYLNIFVEAPRYLLGNNQIVGLCDDDHDDDDLINGNTVFTSRNEWAKSWRVVEESENLFSPQGRVEKLLVLSDAISSDDIYPVNRYSCSAGEGAEVFEKEEASRKGVDLSHEVCQKDPPAFIPGNFDPNYVPINPESPLVFESEHDKTKAVEFCTDVFGKGSQLAKLCGSRLSTTALEEYYTTCLTDAAHTGSFEFTQDAVMVLMEECTPSWDSTHQHEDNTTLPVSEILCPNMCSFRGDCVDQMCQCDTGFTGFDCGNVITDNSCWEILDVQQDPVLDDAKCESTVCWEVSTRSCVDSIVSPITSVTFTFDDISIFERANTPFTISQDDTTVTFSMYIPHNTSTRLCLVFSGTVESTQSNSRISLTGDRHQQHDGDAAAAAVEIRSSLKVPATMSQCSYHHCPYSIIGTVLDSNPMLDGYVVPLLSGLSVAGYYTVKNYTAVVDSGDGEPRFAWDLKRTSASNFPVTFENENVPIRLNFDLENTNNYKCTLRANMHVELTGFVHWTGVHFWSSSIKNMAASDFNVQCRCFATPGNSCLFETPPYFRSHGTSYPSEHVKYWHENVAHAQLERLGWGIKDMMNRHIDDHATLTSDTCTQFFAS